MYRLSTITYDRFGTNRGKTPLKQDYQQIKMLEVAPQVYAAGQLFESDLALIAKQGARSIVNTRPDDETEGQPKSTRLAEAAAEFGIRYVSMPIDPASISRDDAEAFANACADLERPLIVCSRSGALSAKIWETAESI